MDYLTKYYKNLSEQLQGRINYLQRQLHEEDTEGQEYPATDTQDSSTLGPGPFNKSTKELPPEEHHERILGVFHSLPRDHRTDAVIRSSSVGSLGVGRMPYENQLIRTEMTKMAGEDGFKTFDHAMDALEQIHIKHNINDFADMNPEQQEKHMDSVRSATIRDIGNRMSTGTYGKNPQTGNFTYNQRRV